MFEENILFEELTDEELSGFRLCLAEKYWDIDQESLEVMLDRTLAKMTPEDANSFLKTLKQVGKAAIPVIGKTAQVALPVIGQVAQAAGPAVGAAIGTAVAPGVGTAIGGALGSVGGALGNVAGQTLGNVAGQTLTGGTTAVNIPQATNVNNSQPNLRQNSSVPANSLSGTQRTQTSVSPAANQLLQLVQNPQFLQALASLITRTQGVNSRESINIRSQEKISSVPIGAFLNLLESLANQAAMEAAQNESVIPSYLEDSNGEALCDLANPDERARVLMELLQESQNFYQETDYDEDDDYENDEEVFDWLETAGLVEERFF